MAFASRCPHFHSPLLLERGGSSILGSLVPGSKRSDLESFLIERSRQDLTLGGFARWRDCNLLHSTSLPSPANKLYWYLYVEAGDKESVYAPIYQVVHDRFMKSVA